MPAVPPPSTLAARCPAAPQTPAASRGVSLSAGEGRATVLLAHSSPVLRLGMAELLRRSRRFALLAETDRTAEACELVARYRPALLVLGLTLSGTDGLDLIAAVRQLSPETGAVVLTARSDPEWLQRAFRAGARGYVMVQDEPDRLVEALDDVLEGKLHASALASRLFTRALSELPTAGRRAPVERLTNRELLILRLMGGGEGPSTIARALGVSVKTVETHQANLRMKFGCRSAAELKAQARRWFIFSTAADLDS